MKSRAIALVCAALFVLPAAAAADTPVTLTGAHFDGLTEVDVATGDDLGGITADDVAIVKPGGATVPASAITVESTANGQLVVRLTADQFARTTSVGTTIATRAFGGNAAAAPVAVARPGEPAANAHILGSSQWTDNGWSTSLTDPSFDDPVTGQHGLYRFQDITPDRDDAGDPVAWNDGNVTTPAHRDLRMLVLFVQFPDRLAANSPAGWQTMQPYMDFLQPASAFWNTASYGQLNVDFVSPQAGGGLP
jgi:hypothetical protein